MILPLKKESKEHSSTSTNIHPDTKINSTDWSWNVSRFPLEIIEKCMHDYELEDALIKSMEATTTVITNMTSSTNSSLSESQAKVSTAADTSSTSSSLLANMNTDTDKQLNQHSVGNNVQSQQIRKSYIHIDRFMTGVAGYDSWTPNIHPDYLISPENNDLVLIVKLQPYCL